MFEAGKHRSVAGSGELLQASDHALGIELGQLRREPFLILDRRDRFEPWSRRKRAAGHNVFVVAEYRGEVHEVSVRETYINAALQDATDRIRLAI
jgi:hypothetical protein